MKTAKIREEVEARAAQAFIWIWYSLRWVLPKRWRFTTDTVTYKKTKR